MIILPVKRITHIIILVLLSLILSSGTPHGADRPLLANDLPNIKSDKITDTIKGPLMLPGPEGVEQIGKIIGDPEKGKPVFLKYCTHCHGKKGLGNGMAAIALKPSPANFVKLKTYKKNTQMLFEIVTYGLKGSYQLDMPAWGPVLPKQDRANVIAYIKELTKQ